MFYFIKFWIDVDRYFTAKESLATETEEELEVLIFVEIIANELEEGLVLVDPERNGSIIDFVRVDEFVAFILLIVGGDFIEMFDVEHQVINEISFGKDYPIEALSPLR